MIDFRLSQAGYDKKASLFQEKAIKRIYQFTRGYPRKVSLICHRALKLTVMKNNVVVDERTIREIIDQDAQNGWPASPAGGPAPNSILKG